MSSSPRACPRKAIYKTSITDLGQSVNFGRLFWRTTPLRMIDGTPVETPDAAVGVKMEVRTGRDGDPAVYHEYMETGFERVVSRERYENQLRTRQFRPNLESPIVTLEPRPGLRASIGYDDENWTFWSVPFTQPGLPLNLRSGSYLQLRIALESRSFDDFVRLDSLWIETAPTFGWRHYRRGRPAFRPATCARFHRGLLGAGNRLRLRPASRFFAGPMPRALMRCASALAAAPASSA